MVAINSLVNVQNVESNGNGPVVEYNGKSSIFTEKSKPSVTLNAAALSVAILLALGAAATLVAIYMPGHMPEAISAFVDILESFKEILVPTASVVVGLSVFGMFYESAQIHKKNNVSLSEDLHTLESESTSKNQLQ